MEEFSQKGGEMVPGREKFALIEGKNLSQKWKDFLRVILFP
jgi:hypothetical protein